MATLNAVQGCIKFHVWIGIKNTLMKLPIVLINGLMSTKELGQT